MKNEMHQNRKERICYVIYYTAYTVLFILCFRFAVTIFEKNDASFIWELDGAPVLYPAYEYVGRYFRSFLTSFMNDVVIQVRQYDFSLGLGKSIIQYAGNWYLEPLSLLAVLFREEDLVSAYDFFVALRYYMCGITFSLFCFHKKEGCFAALMGSMAYVFSFYTLFWGVRFPLFLVPMIYLPLLLIGMDKQLQEDKSTLLIGIVFLSAWTHYYYFVINTVFLGIYFIMENLESVRLYDSRKEIFQGLLKKGGGVFKSYVIGCSMAAVILLPNIYVFLHANRKSGKLNIPNIWWYGKTYYQNLWCCIAAPFEGFSIGYEAVLGLLPISLVGILLLAGDRKERNILRYLAMGTVCLLFPIGSYILCGCSNVNNRWIYGFVFLTSYGLCRFFSKSEDISFRQRNIIIAYIVIYGISIYTVCKHMQSEYIFAYIALFLVSFLGMMIMCKIRKPFGYVVMTGIMCAQIIAWEYYLYAPRQFNYVSQFMNKRDVDTKICELATGLSGAGNHNTFYRMDVIEAQRSNLAGSVLMRYYGISDYSNVMSNDTYQYLLAVENAGLQEDIMNYDLDGRTYLLAQNAVKYVACYESMESYLPFGYSFYKDSISLKGIPFTIYQNEFALPLGYTYDTYILESECKECTPLEMQELFLNTLVLEQDIGGMEKVRASEMENHTMQLNCQIADMNNIERNGNVYTVLEGGGNIVIDYNGVNDAETYIRFKNLNVSENDFLDWMWFIDNGSGNGKSLFLMSDYNYYRPDTHHYTVNLGYAATPSGRCTVHIPQQGTFALDEIEVLAQKFDGYEETIDRRKEFVLKNIVEDGGFISGDIAVDCNKLLFLSIPYDSGWRASIDGTETELLKANQGYMALLLPSGNHHIEMRYTIPGIKVGMVLSLAGWILYFIDFLAVHFYKGRG